MTNAKTDYSLIYLDGRRTTLRLGHKPLNQGADGIIFGVPEKQLALKIYHDPAKDPERADKIRRMLESPPDDVGMAHFAWPVALVLNKNEQFVGYAMPLLPVADYANLDLLLTRRGRDLGKLLESRSFRVKAAGNLAARVAQLHAKGHCIIDMKPANLLVNRDTADIVVVDCDGFAIQAKNQFLPGHQYTAGYIAPEAWSQEQKPETLGQPQDLFALAVIIFQLLNEGLHPYQGVPKGKAEIPPDTQSRIGKGLYAYGNPGHRRIDPSPWSLHRDFPNIVTDLFSKAFRDHEPRPQASEWETILAGAFERLTVCQKNRNHAFWGNVCPQCQQSDVAIDVKKPRARPRRNPRPAYPHRSRPSAPTQTAAPALPSRVAGIAFVIFIVLVLGGQLYSESQKRERQELAQQQDEARQKAWVEEYKRTTWRHLGNRTPRDNRHQSKHPLPDGNPFALPANRNAPPQDNPALPYFSAGHFSNYSSIPLLSFSPMSSGWDYTKQAPVSLTYLDVPGGAFQETNLSYPVGSSYQLRDWHVSPESGALYARKCGFQLLCHQLARFDRAGDEVLFPVVQAPENDGSGKRRSIPPWLFEVTDDDQIVVIAGPETLAVYNTSAPKQPLADIDYPADYQSLWVSDLAITPDGKHIYVALSRIEEYGLSYQATVLEYHQENGALKLMTDFAKHWPDEQTKLAPAVEVSADGQTLVIGEYSNLEDDNTRYRLLNKPVTVRVAHSGLRVWTKPTQESRWAAGGAFALPRASVVQGPDNPATPSFALASVFTETYRFNLNFQLSADGNTLLSGLEQQSGSKKHQWIARAWLFGIDNEKPVLKHRIEDTLNLGATLPPQREIQRLNPFARLSDDGREAVIGWAAYERNAYNDAKRDMHLTVSAFRFGKQVAPGSPQVQEH
ncbi:protein kinase domain-containing protein [Marinobacter daepoensis]|uniref:protein kinase domain-containing protein n=1 Tax=Marinobacter daepoensis TaxID=262077 RepID=UPI000421756D|nr:hypothetical protein [Marinobacter daepoensis]